MNDNIVKTFSNIKFLDVRFLVSKRRREIAAVVVIDLFFQYLLMNSIETQSPSRRTPVGKAASLI